MSVVVSSQDGAQSENACSKTTSEEKHQETYDWKSLIPERVSEVYMAGSPGKRSDAALVGFPEHILAGLNS
ncbi:zona pellucida protein C [Tachysurus ichikawai]